MKLALLRLDNLKHVKTTKEDVDLAVAKLQGIPLMILKWNEAAGMYTRLRFRELIDDNRDEMLKRSRLRPQVSR